MPRTELTSRCVLRSRDLKSGKSANRNCLKRSTEDLRRVSLPVHWATDFAACSQKRGAAIEIREKWAPTGGDFTLENASCGVVAALHAAVN